MSSLYDILKTHYQKDSLSHAYLIESSKKQAEEQILDFLEKEMGLNIHSNPDIIRQESEILKIDEARELKKRASVKASETEGSKIFIIGLDMITGQAQNSLLKLFEEPPENTHFFVITPNSDILLPTLYSRLAFIFSDKEGGEDEQNWSYEFLSSSPPDRLKMAEDIIKNKDKITAISVINQLEKKVYESSRLKNMDKNTLNFLKELESCRSYLYGQAPSVKMIMEHISLTAPTFGLSSS